LGPHLIGDCFVTRSDRYGAPKFPNCTPFRNSYLELEKLQRLADSIIADEEISPGPKTEQVEDLLLIGTSMGGARPKAVVEDDEGLWIAKFNRADDKWNEARVERAMLVLARDCGIQSAESKVVTIGDRDVLLVKRFDREKARDGYLRARMISGLTVLRTEDTHQHRDRWSYVLLAEELRRISSAPQRDAAEHFRRMCFNVLITNTDDHPRNHAFIAKNRDWKLSPAYDLMPSTPISLERRDLAMSCGDLGRYANAENLLSQSERFLVKPQQAEPIVSELEKKIEKSWYETARQEGVSEKDCGKIKGAFVYPGFRLALQDRAT